MEAVNKKHVQELSGADEINTMELKMGKAGAEEFNVKRSQALGNLKDLMETAVMEHLHRMHTMHGNAGRSLRIRKGVRVHDLYHPQNR